MQLALHLGMPHEAMLRSMTEAELHRWILFARRHGLPFRRIELMLAQLSMIVAKTMGGAKNAKTADFMLIEPDDVLPENLTRVEAVRRAVGFNPRKKKAN